MDVKFTNDKTCHVAWKDPIPKFAQRESVEATMGVNILFYCLENDGQALEHWIGTSPAYTALLSFSVV